MVTDTGVYVICIWVPLTLNMSGHSGVIRGTFHKIASLLQQETQGP